MNHCMQLQVPLCAELNVKAAKLLIKSTYFWFVFYGHKMVINLHNPPSIKPQSIWIRDPGLEFFSGTLLLNCISDSDPVIKCWMFGSRALTLSRILIDGKVLRATAGCVKRSVYVSQIIIYCFLFSAWWAKRHGQDYEELLGGIMHIMMNHVNHNDDDNRFWLTMSEGGTASSALIPLSTARSPASRRSRRWSRTTRRWTVSVKSLSLNIENNKPHLLCQ